MNDFLNFSLNSLNLLDNQIHDNIKGSFVDNFIHELQNYLELQTSDKILENLPENSNLHFNQVEKEDMDMYQSNSIFKYFYVRNNLYLEKLSNEDIENLLSNDSNKKDIVLRTFKDIINIDDGYKVCYGPDTDNFWYDSDILVLGFRFLEFSDNGLSDEAWEEEFYKKRTYLNNMFSSLEASLTEKLGLKVKICEYDEYSIINNKNIEK